MVERLFAREKPEYDRGVGFFDAIYGFAITLLIANIDLPQAESWRSMHALLSDGLADQLLGFVISFIVIATFWKRNAELLSHFLGLDGALIVANLALVGLIVFLPFTTQGISDPKVSDYPLATVLYALNIALAILTQLVMWEIARSRGLVVDDVPGARWAVRIDAAAQAAVFLVSIPVAAAAGPTAGQLTWLLLPIVAIVTGRWRHRVTQRALGENPTQVS
ncbi:TMEM175 family protein [Propionimicrobium sp. PCR01-08-3]|uniref:TMEM175 family protein n=1 Tax=Propionimicrobium sp. PCR01-08-3 TaxID=3052086 RepID=UPI00255C8D70|nr:TMEM175 family protein [Propionimicrobium sp. PCR01-08-3]WIY83076.1 TMEM175 family protein [Propionimicrobium sp. PCR01-08-3]